VDTALAFGGLDHHDFLTLTKPPKARGDVDMGGLAPSSRESYPRSELQAPSDAVDCR
jgi:hypothetical protein